MKKIFGFIVVAIVATWPYLLAGLILFFLGACSPISVVRNPGMFDQYAPQGQQVEPGVVSFLNEGSMSKIEDRRKEAYKTMHEICSGKYAIVNQEIKTVHNKKNSFDFTYIEFICK